MDGISVIIPLYNKEKTIETSLKNLLKQSVNTFEIIIVNDGSTDNSIERIKPYSKSITILNQKNQGPSSARNHGARHANFDVLTFLDADDTINTNFIESHLAIRKSDPDIDLSLNSFDVYENNKLKRSEILSNRTTNTSLMNGDFIVDGFHSSFVANIHSGGYCINKDLFLKSKGFDESLRCWEITDALTRYSLNANKIAALDEVLSLKFDDNSNSLFFKEKQNLEQHRLFCKNILKYLDQIPFNSKSQYFNEIKYLCINYWKKFKLYDLAEIYSDSIVMADADKLLKLPFKVDLTARLVSKLFSKKPN